MPRSPSIAAFATQGTGHREEERILALLTSFDPQRWGFDRRAKRRETLRLIRRGLAERPDLIVMEGTGVAGGAALLVLSVVRGTPYVVSAGDAVGPFLASRHRWLGPLARLYEKLLYRRSHGVVGWTPYIAGRAITLGAPRAMYAANWAPGSASLQAGRDIRVQLGLNDEHVVFGLVGSLDWNARARYCYGAELVSAAARIDRDDVRIVVVGDGTGLERLRALAGEHLGNRIILPGSVPRDEVQAWLRAFDVGSLPQSTDAVGAVRYTTKLSEYVAARLPIITGEIPLAYEFAGDWIWRLPGDAPWDETYISALATLMGTISREEIAHARAAVPELIPTFDQDRQAQQVHAFVSDVLARARR